MRFLPILAAALALAGCLKTQPLITAENAYDPRLALTDDSLSTFDRLEVVLVDERDTGLAIRVWEGHPDSLGVPEIEFAGDGRTLVFLVRGYRLDQLCLSEIIAQDGRVRHKALLCPSANDVAPILKPPALGFSGNDSALMLRVEAVPGSAGRMFRLEAPPWLDIEPDLFQGDSDITLEVRLRRESLAEGINVGSIRLIRDGVLTASVAATAIRAGGSVPADSPAVKRPWRILRGKVVDWDSLPAGGMSVTLDGGPNLRLTDSAGYFDFGTTDSGTHVLSVSGPSRMGVRDTVRMDGQDVLTLLLRVSPVIGVRSVPLNWSRDPGPVTIISGRGLVPSMGFREPGLLADFPLGDAAPTLQRFHDLGNGDDKDIPTYSEPGAMTADNEAVFLAYPEDSRLGRVGNPVSLTGAMNKKIGMQPGALQSDGGALLVLGRLGDGTLALGEYGKEDLSLVRLDTLKGFHWDGVVPMQKTPRLAATENAYYAIEGNSPADPGRLIRIDKVTRKVTASVELEDASASDLAILGDIIYVGFPASARKVIRKYDRDLLPAGTIPADHPVRRIAFAVNGRFAGCGFILAEGGITVFRPGEEGEAARLPMPASAGTGHLAVDPESGTAIVSDGTNVFQIGL